MHAALSQMQPHLLRPTAPLRWQGPLAWLGGTHGVRRAARAPEACNEALDVKTTCSVQL
jgi:hypothetical protein